MVEADRLPPSILDIYVVFEHIDIIDMLSIGIQQQPSHTVTISILVGSDFWVLSHLCLWSQNDVNTSWSGVFAPPANALGLSIKEKDLLFCKLIGIGRWPLPLPSYLCNPANALGLSIEMRADMRLILILWLMEMRPHRKKTGSTGLSKPEQRLHAPCWSQSLQHKRCQDCKHMAGVSCHF